MQYMLLIYSGDSMSEFETLSEILDFRGHFGLLM
jgi:hypothetical protein